MTVSERSRGSTSGVVIPLGLILTAVAAGLLIAYGLRLIDAAPPRIGAVTVERGPTVTSPGAGHGVAYVPNTNNDATQGKLDILSASEALLGDLSLASVSRRASGVSHRGAPTHDGQRGDPDPLTNSVTVSLGAGEGVVEAAFMGEVDAVNPAVGVGAFFTPQAAARGEEVLYSVTASNLGGVDVGPITVTDSLRGDLSASFPPTLAPGAAHGQTFSWTIPPNAPDPLIGTFTVRAAPDGEVISDTATVVLDLLQAAVEVSTTVRPVAIVPGGTVTYTVTLGNVGQVDLEAITVTDSLQGVLSPSFPPTLTVGTSQRQPFAWAIKSNDSLPLTRTVTVRARGGGQVVSDTATAAVDTLKPVLRVEPSVVPTTTVRGGETTYSVTVVNAGDVDAGNIRVSDSILGDVSHDFPRIVPAGASHSRAYTWASPPDASGPLTRSVTVSGEGAGQVVSDTTTGALNLAGVTASLSGPARVRAGERVMVTVDVTNTSSADAPNLVLKAFAGGGRGLAIPDTCLVLAHGEACTFSYGIAVPSEGDVLTSSVKVRYRPEGLGSGVTDVAEHTVSVIPLWQKGAGIPAGVAVRTLTACPAIPDLLYAGFGSGGRGVYWSGDAGLSWTATALEGADVFDIAIDPRECDTVYAGTRRDGVMRSEDGGRSWDGASEDLERASVHGVVVDPSDPDVIYAGTAQRGVYRSDDGGATWRAWGLRSLPVVDLSVTADGEAVYAATWGGGVYRRPDRSRSASLWRAINEGIADEHREVCDVAVDGKDGAMAFAATASGGVYRTLDGGRSWRRVLPSPELAYAVAVDPEYGEMVYAGTAQGAFRSVSGGDPGSWESFDANLENLAVRAVAIGPRAEVVHLGTADGAWRHRR